MMTDLEAMGITLMRHAAWLELEHGAEAVVDLLKEVIDAILDRSNQPADPAYEQSLDRDRLPS